MARQLTLESTKELASRNINDPINVLMTITSPYGDWELKPSVEWNQNRAFNTGEIASMSSPLAFFRAKTNIFTPTGMNPNPEVATDDWGLVTINEWSADNSYISGSYVRYNGVDYVSKTEILGRVVRTWRQAGSYTNTAGAATYNSGGYFYVNKDPVETNLGFNDAAALVSFLNNTQVRVYVSDDSTFTPSDTNLLGTATAFVSSGGVGFSITSPTITRNTFGTNVGIYNNDYIAVETNINDNPSADTTRWQALTPNSDPSIDTTNWDGITPVVWSGDVAYPANTFTVRNTFLYKNSQQIAAPTSTKVYVEMGRWRDGDSRDAQFASLSSGNPSPQQDITNWSPVSSSAWNEDSAYSLGSFVVFNDVLYRATAAISASIPNAQPNQNPTQDTARWTNALTLVNWNSTAGYTQGTYTVRNGILYKAKKDIPVKTGITQFTERARWLSGPASNVGRAAFATPAASRDFVFNVPSQTNNAPGWLTSGGQTGAKTGTWRLSYVNTETSVTLNTITGSINKNWGGGNQTAIGALRINDPDTAGDGAADMAANFDSVGSTNPFAFANEANRVWTLEEEVTAPPVPNEAPENDSENWTALTVNAWSGTVGYSVEDVALYQSNYYEVEVDIPAPGKNNKPNVDTTRWSVVPHNAWNNAIGYGNGETVLYNNVFYQSSQSVAAATTSEPRLCVNDTALSGASTYIEIGRWDDTSADYRTAGSADYTNFGGATFCANRNPLGNATDPFPLNTSTTYRLRYVPGGSATQAAAEIIGTPTQAHIDTNPGGGIACYRFGSANEMTAKFGQPVSNPHSPSSFNGGQWILEEQTTSAGVAGLVNGTSYQVRFVPSSVSNPTPSSPDWSKASVWSNTSAYSTNDVVAFNNVAYRADANIAAPAEGSVNSNPLTDTANWTALGTPEWNANSSYMTGDYVHHKNIVYKAERNVVVNSIPTNSDWVKYDAPGWSGLIPYNQNDYTNYKGVLYKANNNITKPTTSTSNINLGEVDGGSGNQIRYQSFWIGACRAGGKLFFFNNFLFGIPVPQYTTRITAFDEITGQQTNTIDLPGASTITNGHARGIFADGDKIYVVFGTTAKAYNTTDLSAAGGDISNFPPTGVLIDADDKFYIPSGGSALAYNKNDRSRDSASDISLPFSSGWGGGFLGNDGTLYFIRGTDNAAYAFNKATSARESAKDISLPSASYTGGTYSDDGKGYFIVSQGTNVNRAIAYGNTTISSDTTNWSQITTPTWSATSGYDEDDNVKYNDEFYQAGSDIFAVGNSPGLSYENALQIESDDGGIHCVRLGTFADMVAQFGTAPVGNVSDDKFQKGTWIVNRVDIQQGTLNQPPEDDAINWARQTTSSWSGIVSYMTNDIVIFNSNYFQAIQAVTAQFSPIVDWSPTTAYALSQVVSYGTPTAYYRSRRVIPLASTANDSPLVDTERWEAITAEVWTTGRSFRQGSYVIRNGKLYNALLAAYSIPPEEDLRGQLVLHLSPLQKSIQSRGLTYESAAIRLSLPDENLQSTSPRISLAIDNIDMAFMPYIRRQQLREARIRLDYVRTSTPDTVEWSQNFRIESVRATQAALDFTLTINGLVARPAVREYYSSLTSPGLYDTDPQNETPREDSNE